MPALSFDHITIDKISFIYQKGIEVDVLRLDKISPVISGNKWFKLRYYLEEAKALHKKGILTFGGAWSNHIIATAAACRMAGLHSIGIIRGEEPMLPSPTILQAREYGMELVFVPRSSYQSKEISPALRFEEYLVVDEGGYGLKGAKGAATILDFCDKSYTHYCCAVGTGTMMAGLITAIAPDQEVIGISVLKNDRSLNEMIQTLVANKKDNWQLLHDYHFGGYARHQPALLSFMNEFFDQTGIPSDFVYTGKLFFGISDLIRKNYFAANSKLLLIHSGGLQGNQSLPQGTLIF